MRTPELYLLIYINMFILMPENVAHPEYLSEVAVHRDDYNNAIVPDVHVTLHVVHR